MFSTLILKQFLVLMPGYLLQMCYGMNTAFTAVMTPQLMENGTEFLITEDQEGWVVSIDNIIVPCMSILSGILQTRFGPAKILLFTGLPYLLGWIIAIFATNIWYIYLSRLFVGTSHAFLTTSIYAIEISTKDMRATFSFLEGVPRCLGSILVYVLGMYFRWQYIAYVGWVVPLVAMIAMWFCPESPVYLINHDKSTEASDVLRKLNADDDSAEQALNALKRTHQSLLKKQKLGENTDNKDDNLENTILDHIWYKRTYKQFFTRKELYRPFFFITFLTIIQQFSGMTVIRSYVVKIFNEIGSSGRTDKVKNDAYICAIILSIVRLIASLSVSKWSKTQKRRSVYFTSAGLTTISLVLIGTCIYFTKRSDLGDNGKSISYWITLVSTCLLAFSVQIGVQSMPHLLSGELYPGDLRAKGKAMSRAITCILILLTLKFYLPLKNAITDYGVFYLFAGVILASLPLVYFKNLSNKDDHEEASNWFYMPETKGISLDEVRYFYTQRSVMSQEKTTNKV